jgi:GTP:adenosylcobinamide-phosphate guanylyltransferase
MDAVVTAGSRPQTNEPLYEFTHGAYKAMIEIAGKPMIQWVLDALSASTKVDRVVVVGLPPYTNLFCDHPLTILEDQGGLLANVRAGMQELSLQNPNPEHILLLTSDTPALTTEMVNWTIEKTLETDHEFLYPVVERPVMEKRFPGAKRTYIHLKDVEVCGGDMMGIQAHLASKTNPVWDDIVDKRKNPLKQAFLLGIDTLFMVLLRQLSLAEASVSLSKRLGIRARAVLCPFAEIGMDIDKPHQFHLVEADLARLQVA